VARKRKHPEHVNHERWLVSYADFITLLFAFFTTLYAISTVDQKKAGKLMYSMMTAFNVEFFQGSAPPPSSGVIAAVQGAIAGSHRPIHKKEPELSAMARKIAALAETPALRGKFQVRMEARGLVVSLAEAGFFESGSAAIRPDALAAVAELAQVFAPASMNVTVEGHTDNVPVRSGKYASNWELSTARSTSVVAFLIDQGISADRLSAAGYGEFKPVAGNDTPEGRARNRRVDLVIAPPPADLSADAEAPALTTPAPPTP
jgi:chemotaxis protein MotB